MSRPDAPSALSEADVREPLRALLSRRTAVRAPPSASAGSTASAVLLALFADDDGDTRLWLVKRASGLRRHSAQVALPGGKVDEVDASPAATALREAEEEIGLPPDAVDVLGRLDDLVTGTGFTITPIVGWVTAPFDLRPNPSEVAKVFHAPLRVFFARPRGIPPFHGHTIDGELVWGATGKIVRDLVEVMRG